MPVLWCHGDPCHQVQPLNRSSLNSLPSSVFGVGTLAMSRQAPAITGRRLSVPDSLGSIARLTGSAAIRTARRHASPAVPSEPGGQRGRSLEACHPDSAADASPAVPNGPGRTTPAYVAAFLWTCHTGTVLAHLRAFRTFAVGAATAHFRLLADRLTLAVIAPSCSRWTDAVQPVRTALGPRCLAVR